MCRHCFQIQRPNDAENLVRSQSEEELDKDKMALMPPAAGASPLRWLRKHVAHQAYISHTSVVHVHQSYVASSVLTWELWPTFACDGV